jgi:hypothetical protein
MSKSVGFREMLADQKLLGENYIHILGNERWHQWDWRNKH